MDAIIGRYSVQIEENELILTHKLGISFELTLQETLALRDFISVYQEALIDVQRETEHRLPRIVLEKPTKQNE